MSKLPLSYLGVLCVLAVQMYFSAFVAKSIAFVFALSAASSRASAESTSAADTRQPIAALVSFQRHPPSQPPCKNVNSAAFPVLPACHFSGKIAFLCNKKDEHVFPHSSLYSTQYLS